MYDVKSEQNNFHVLIATPAFQGKVNTQYALSLAETISVLSASGIRVSTHIVPSGSLLVHERNRALQMFWESDATHILCIDSDLGWPAQAVLAMLNAKKDFIGGCYPSRKEDNSFLFRPVKKQDESLVTEKHLIKMQYIPAGFILLSRDCIRKMREHFPELYYCPKIVSPDCPPPGFLFFNTEIYDGEFWGEDFVFCRRAQEAGIDIWVDPLIQFDHDGKIGMLLECLSSERNSNTNLIMEFSQKQNGK